MTTEKERAAEEAQIRALIERWASALRAKDADGVLSCAAGEFVHFSLAPPLVSADSSAKALAGWFATWQGPIGYEIRDLRIAVGDDVAFSHSLNRLSGTQAGGPTELWFRHTFGLRKIGGDWKIVHEHESVPFLMDGSFRAAVDLRP